MSSDYYYYYYSLRDIEIDRERERERERIGEWECRPTKGKETVVVSEIGRKIYK